MAVVTDRIKQLDGRDNRLSIQLANNEYFALRKSHTNYDTLAAMVLVAATNQFTITIRSSDTNNDVEYILIGWPQ